MACEAMVRPEFHRSGKGGKEVRHSQWSWAQEYFSSSTPRTQGKVLGRGLQAHERLSGIVVSGKGENNHGTLWSRAKTLRCLGPAKTPCIGARPHAPRVAPWTYCRVADLVAAVGCHTRSAQSAGHRGLHAGILDHGAR